MSLRNNTLQLSNFNYSSKFDILFEETPEQWIGFKPALGNYVFPCYSCRHMFSCLQSFQDHINRRVMVLKYKCSNCANGILTFYNRCSLLLHTRNHYILTEGKINLLEIDIFTLPVSLAGFLPHPNIPILYPTEENEVLENEFFNTKFYTPDISEKGKQTITLKPSNLIFQEQQNSLALIQICPNVPKCKFVTVEYQENLIRQHTIETENLNNNNVPDVEAPEEIKEEPPDEPIPVMTMPVISKVETVTEKTFKLPKCLDCDTYQRCTMAEHYLGKNKPLDASLNCPVCKFLASSPCSLKAHIRIHENLPPFVCPDCGKDFSSWSLLRKHMDEVCFHLAKHVRFRCSGKRCGKLFAMSSTFAVHFQVHLNSYFSCSICGALVLTAEEAETHKLSHNEFCCLQKFYHCPLCPDVGDLTEDTFSSHVNTHATDMKRCLYVYICKHCRSYFRSTTTYATHLLKCTNKQTVRVKKYDIPRYITRECEKCTNKIIFNEQRPASLCNKCKQQMELPKTVTNKRYFCILCNKQINLYEKTYHIKQCKYGKPLVALAKLSFDEIENMSFSSGSDLDSSTSSARLGNLARRRSSDSWKTDDSGKKKRKRPNANPVRQKKIEKSVELDLIAEEPVQFNGIYHCKFCDYQHTDRSKFHEHIKEHRDISTAYQCMECAECFVVKPTLIKHLLHFHNITNHEQYLQENDCFDVEAVKELESIMRLAPGESKEPVKENQCRVCRQQFDEALSLNKHFRIHGMAFLLTNSK